MTLFTILCIVKSIFHFLFSLQYLWKTSLSYFLFMLEIFLTIVCQNLLASAPPLLFYFSQWLLVCMSCWGMFLSLEIWQNTVEFLQSPLQSTFFYCSSACDHFFQHYQHHPDHNHKCRLNPDLRHYHRS